MQFFFGNRWDGYLHTMFIGTITIRLKLTFGYANKKKQ